MLGFIFKETQRAEILTNFIFLDESMGVSFSASLHQLWNNLKLRGKYISNNFSKPFENNAASSVNTSVFHPNTVFNVTIRIRKLAPIHQNYLILRLHWSVNSWYLFPFKGIPWRIYIAFNYCLLVFFKLDHCFSFSSWPWHFQWWQDRYFAVFQGNIIKTKITSQSREPLYKARRGEKKKMSWLMNKH